MTKPTNGGEPLEVIVYRAYLPSAEQKFDNPQPGGEATLNSSHLGQLIALTLFTTLAAPCWLAAQEILKRETKQAHHKLMELVMLDGPYTYSSLDGGGFRILNNARAVPTSVATALHMIGFGFSFRMSMQG